MLRERRIDISQPMCASPLLVRIFSCLIYSRFLKTFKHSTFQIHRWKTAFFPHLGSDPPCFRTLLVFFGALSTLDLEFYTHEPGMVGFLVYARWTLQSLRFWRLCNITITRDSLLAKQSESSVPVRQDVLTIWYDITGTTSLVSYDILNWVGMPCLGKRIVGIGSLYDTFYIDGYVTLHV